MAGESEFSFITVGAAEEEDVVIQAGIVETEEEPQVEAAATTEFIAAEQTAEAAGTAAQDSAPKLDKKAKLEAAFGSKESISAPEKEAPKPKPVSQPVSKPAKEYEEATTLADLESNEPMPAVRLAMIGAALLALAAFLVYFNFFM